MSPYLILFIAFAIGNSIDVNGNPTPGAKQDPIEEFNKLKGDLKMNKQAMCSFLLTQESEQEVKLTLEKVTNLFEQALDHMVKSAEYATLIRPHVDVKFIDEFDKNGGNYVLEVSENRRKVESEYKSALANNATDEEKKEILEKYFFKACASKLGTIIAERTMYDSMMNMEAKLKTKG